MSPRWTKLWRDARATQGRLAMIVLALAAGIAAVTAMLGAYGVLMREVPRSYLSAHPASAQLELARSPNPALLQAVRGLPNVAQAELATTVTARVQVGAGEWLPLMLFVVPDFDQFEINRPAAQAGRFPPPDGSLAIERSALPLAHGQVGDRLTVELPQGGRHTLVVAGTAHDPALAPAWQEQVVYGYVSAATLRALGEPVSLDLLKLVVRNGAADNAAIEATARQVAARLSQGDVPVEELRIPPPQRHPHQAQMSAVLQMLLIFSLLALLLAAVLCATVLQGLLAQQVRQIAIMKAIGARAPQLAALYAVLAGGLGLLAVAVGWPLGSAVGRGLVGTIAELLNLRLQSESVPAWCDAVAVALGLLAPLAAAAGPVWNAVRRTVRQALDDHGVAPGRNAPDRLDRALTRLRLDDAASTLALRNTFRRRARVAMTLLLLGGAGGMLITSLDLKAAWEQTVREGVASRRYDVELVLQRWMPVGQAMQALRAADPAAVVEPWPAQSAARATPGGIDLLHQYPDGAHGGFSLRAAPPATSLVAHRIEQGRWLQAGETGTAVINSLARRLAFRDVRIGDTVTLSVDHRPVALTVVGIVHEPLTPGSVYVTPATFEQATGQAGRTNALRVRSRAATQALAGALEAAGVPVKLALTEARYAAAQGGHVYILVFALGFVASAMAVVGALGLASALGQSVVERTREFGVMRAIGARAASIRRMVVTEGLLIGAASTAAAVVLAWPLSRGVGGVLASISTQDLQPRLAPAAVAVWALIALVGAAGVSLAPAGRAARITVRESLSCL